MDLGLQASYEFHPRRSRWQRQSAMDAAQHSASGVRTVAHRLLTSPSRRAPPSRHNVRRTHSDPGLGFVALSPPRRSSARRGGDGGDAAGEGGDVDAAVSVDASDALAQHSDGGRIPTPLESDSSPSGVSSRVASSQGNGPRQPGRRTRIGSLRATPGSSAPSTPPDLRLWTASTRGDSTAAAGSAAVSGGGSAGGASQCRPATTSTRAEREYLIGTMEPSSEAGGRAGSGGSTLSAGRGANTHPTATRVHLGASIGVGVGIVPSRLLLGSPATSPLSLSGRGMRGSPLRSGPARSPLQYSPGGASRGGMVEDGLPTPRLAPTPVVGAADLYVTDWKDLSLSGRRVEGDDAGSVAGSTAATADSHPSTAPSRRAPHGTPTRPRDSVASGSPSPRQRYARRDRSHNTADFAQHLKDKVCA